MKDILQQLHGLTFEQLTQWLTKANRQYQDLNYTAQNFLPAPIANFRDNLAKQFKEIDDTDIPNEQFIQKLLTYLPDDKTLYQNQFSKKFNMLYEIYECYDIHPEKHGFNLAKLDMAIQLKTANHKIDVLIEACQAYRFALLDERENLFRSLSSQKKDYFNRLFDDIDHSTDTKIALKKTAPIPAGLYEKASPHEKIQYGKLFNLLGQYELVVNAWQKLRDQSKTPSSRLDNFQYQFNSKGMQTYVVASAKKRSPGMTFIDKVLNILSVGYYARFFKPAKQQQLLYYQKYTSMQRLDNAAKNAQRFTPSSDFRLHL